MSVDVRHDLESLHHDISLEETEDTWEKIAKAITALNRICESSGAYENQPSEVVLALKNYHRPITSAMASERTRLSGCTLDMLLAVATGLGSAFEPLLSLYIPPLLALCARTNKVVINRARAALLAVIETAQLVGVLSYFVHSTKDKSASLRLVIAECTLACLNSCNPPDLEKESRMKEIESIIRTFTRDANADVRKISRKIFESYKILFPDRVDTCVGFFVVKIYRFIFFFLQLYRAHVTNNEEIPRHQVRRNACASGQNFCTKVGPENDCQAFDFKFRFHVNDRPAAPYGPLQDRLQLVCQFHDTRKKSGRGDDTSQKGEGTDNGAWASETCSYGGRTTSSRTEIRYCQSAYGTPTASGAERDYSPPAPSAECHFA